MTQPPSLFGRYQLAVKSANVMALVFFALIGWIGWVRAAGDLRAFTLTLLVVVLGSLIGWGAGILATPIAAGDSSRFQKIGQLVSAFVGGYLLSKVDRLLELSLFSGDQVNPAAWEMVGLGAAAFLTMLIVVFVNRWYLHRFVQADEAPRVGAHSDEVP